MHAGDEHAADAEPGDDGGGARGRGVWLPRELAAPAPYSRSTSLDVRGAHGGVVGIVIVVHGLGTSRRWQS